MMSSELVTALAEGIKLVVVLVVNHGFASIGNLSESVGAERFGTRYCYRTKSGLDGALLPVDLAANAASLGAHVLRAATREELADALASALAADLTTVVVVETDPLVPAPDSASWWDVPVAELSTRPAALAARERYEAGRLRQRPLLSPTAAPEPPGSL
jgi:3D-(3,5/4)-trihydroxycyclohexane-1,2-dione acylhydrolase (decyclizing)